MDPIALLFYAIICGALGYVAPSFPSPFLRIVFGVCVGLGAALLLPYFRVLF